MVNPRIALTQKGSDKLGREAVELAAEAGLVLDEWQAYVLVESMRMRPDGRWAAGEVGLNVARQNGKNAILEARELAELYLVGSELTIHSAHNFDTSMEHFYRMRGLIEETPRLVDELAKNGIRTANGSEGFTLMGNRRLRFRTRTKGGGRGFASDLLVFDEAMILPEMAIGALFPTKRARKNPQVWYTGSAVDQLVHEHGVVFSAIRKRGLEESSGLAYFEWSVEGDDPSQVSRETMVDRAAWAQANPALGIRIDPETMAQECESLRHLPRTFAVELLGIGDWPDPDHTATTIDLLAWGELVDETSRVEDPVCLAFDVSPDRFGAVGVSGRRTDGLMHIEVIASRRGTAWMPEYIAERVKRHQPAAVVCDGYGPAASLVSALENLGVEVDAWTAQEHGKACGQFDDAIKDATFRYRPDDALEGAVRSAKTRPLGDAWAWSRRSSSGNIAPLVAVTLAHSAALTMRPKEAVFAWA